MSDQVETKQEQTQPEGMDDIVIDVEQANEVPEQAPPEDRKQPTTPVGVAGYSVDVDNRMLPYLGMIVSAGVLLAAVLVRKHGSKHENYTIAVCSFVFFFGLIGAYMALKPELHDKELGTFPAVGQLTYGRAVAFFLFTWNFICAGILTFNGPFLVTSNGYFACWFLVYFSVLALGVSNGDIKNQIGSLGSSYGLLVASLVQICAICREFGNGYKGESVYSLVVCLITIVIVSTVENAPNMASAKLGLYVLLAVLWVALACIVTFEGPFIDTGNGYFSAWFGCVLSLYAAAALMPERGESSPQPTTA
eukprot:Nitzschia sp. Nitz4//scaffold18_size181773//4725//5842//NITZ4_001888-RA/size181773-snap-gene-0.265-mRNA-1//-1//CDS//3329539930//8378//frame0